MKLTDKSSKQLFDMKPPIINVKNTRAYSLNNPYDLSLRYNNRYR